MTTKNDFLTTNVRASQNQWEEAAVRAVSNGEDVSWPFVEVQLSPYNGHTGSVLVSSDVFSIGTFDDFFRLPLAPLTAQRIADLKGVSLTTRKISRDTWVASLMRLTPEPATSWGQVNRGPNLSQYVTHDGVVKNQLDAADAKLGDLVTGHKKDVVLSNIMSPGHVVIYGWQQRSGAPIQPLFGGHDDHYADYSHGIRFVSPDMIVDGQPMKLTDVMRSPALAGLVSDEGPLREVRYPVPEVLPAEPGGRGGGGGGGGLSVSPNDPNRRNGPFAQLFPLLPTLSSFETFIQAKPGWKVLMAYARDARAKREDLWASLSGEEMTTAATFSDAAVYAGTVLLIGLGLGVVVKWMLPKHLKKGSFS